MNVPGVVIALGAVARYIEVCGPKNTPLERTLRAQPPSKTKRFWAGG